MPDITEQVQTSALEEASRKSRKTPDGLLATAVAMVAAVFLGLIVGAAYAQNHPTLEATLRNFHIQFYNTQAASEYKGQTWLGVPIEKTPPDAWVYQEILHETKPDVLIETGTADGGSAYYFATLFDLMGHGRVITVDIADSPKRPKHNRIAYVRGSSTGPDIVSQVKGMIIPGERVMVSLDSDHRQQHVANELKIYSELVTPGCYMVVEDTNVNGHPVWKSFGPGPMEALQDFLKVDSRYQTDRSREKFGLTFFPEGWLKRVH